MRPVLLAHFGRAPAIVQVAGRYERRQHIAPGAKVRARMATATGAAYRNPDRLEIVMQVKVSAEMSQRNA